MEIWLSRLRRMNPPEQLGWVRKQGLPYTGEHPRFEWHEKGLSVTQLFTRLHACSVFSNPCVSFLLSRTFTLEKEERKKKRPDIEKSGNHFLGSLVPWVLSLRAVEVFWTVKTKLPVTESVFKHMLFQARQLLTAWVLHSLLCSAVNFDYLKAVGNGR